MPRGVDALVHEEGVGGMDLAGVVGRDGTVAVWERWVGGWVEEEKAV